MVSCSDYDDDINSLTGRVDALEKTVADLKTAIESGSVITNVQSTENGVTVTLSDGKTFEVKNGTNGTPGSVIDIQTVDGVEYWFLDNKNTGYPVKGVKGDDGKDGCWYVPDEDGYWHKQYYNEDGTVADEATEIKWTPSAESSVRVVYDKENGYLQITNAKGMEEDQIINIPITSNLKSLAVIPYVLDDKTPYPKVYFFNIMGLDAKTGKIEVAGSTNAKAHYRLNPANANVQDWNWAMIDRTVTRAAGDNNELLTVAATSRENDEFIVTLKSNESLENLKDNEHAIAALQGTNKETAEVITSDYIKVESCDLKDFAIVTGVPEFINELPKINSTSYAGVHEDEDVRMLYTESLDLNTIVKTQAKDLNKKITIPVLVEDLVDEGELTYQFTLPEKYELGENKTNQQDFVTLDGSVLKVNTEKWPNGTGAIGITPIVEVTALVNGKIIATGVLKVGIVEKDAVEKPAYVVTVTSTNKEYSDLKANEVVNKFSWEDMRQVYDALSITREEFIKEYTTVTVEDNDGVKLTDQKDISEGVATNVVEMTIDPTKVASNETGTVKVTYTATDKYTYAPIVIEFPYTISHKHVSYPEFNSRFVDVDKALATIKGQMINDVWTQKVEISEHFLLDSYKADGNHQEPVLEIDKEKLPAGTTYELTTGTLKTQELTLTSPIVGNYLDIPVNVVIALDNDERICVKSYTIRFVNPLRLTPSAIELTAPFPGKLDEKSITYVVKDTEGRVIITNGKAEKDNEYGITDDMITVDYAEGEDWSVFGINNDKTQKLTLDKDKPSIKWENKGTALAKPVNTTYKVTVSVKGIAVMTEEGNVTVTETEM